MVKILALAKKGSLLLLLVLLSSCGQVKIQDPFKDPVTGKVDIQKVLDAARYGLEADHLIPGAVAQDIYNIGINILNLTQAVVDKNPTAEANAVAGALQAGLDILPPDKKMKVGWYFQFAIDYLNQIK